MSCRGVVIGWVPVSRRSETIARALGYRLHLVPRPGFGRRWTTPGYLVSALRSAWVVLRHRPRSVVVMAPPVFAPLTVVPVARLVGARVAVDVHSGAVLDPRWRWSVPWLAWAARRGIATVTLESIAQRLARRGVRSLIVPDPLPTIGADAAATASEHLPRTNQAGDRPLVVAICGWGLDEPIEELVAAAGGASWDLAITGRQRREFNLPRNVTMTGFLNDDAYARLLRGSSLIVTLTRRDETLLSGAWEALAVGKPLVVSSTATLREAFGPEIASLGDGRDDIRAGIDRALGRLPTQGSLVVQAARRFSRANQQALETLRQALEADR